MKTRFLCAFLAPWLLFVPACVVSNDTTTLYFAPEGKVEMVVLKNNVHSDKAAGEKQKEEQQWLKDFKSQNLDELKKLTQTGAREVKAVLLREAVPYAATLTATYDTVQAFGRYFDFNTPASSNTMEWTQHEKRRKLTLRFVDNSKKKSKNERAEPCLDSCPVFRFILEKGKVINSRGFVVNKDRTSCLLDFDSIQRLSAHQKQFTVFVEWEII